MGCGGREGKEKGLKKGRERSRGEGEKEEGVL